MEKTISDSAVSFTPKTAAHFMLGDLQIGLFSNNSLVDQFSRQFLEDWIAFGEKSLSSNDDIQIYLELVEQLPDLPDTLPFYQGDGRYLRDNIGALSVYAQPNGYLLYFFKGGLVQITANDSLIHGAITVDLLKYGRLYDLIFTSISSILRQQNIYLVHASAAVHGETASIFVGPPGCAKSTTVLNLAFNGWGVLSNDTLLIREQSDGIYALPTPGGFSIRPKSVRHIPALATSVPHPLPDDFYHLSLSKLGLSWGEPALINRIYFPKVVDESENQVQPLSSAVALAHLIELSLDRWDKAALPRHFTFLERLTTQASAASLAIANQNQLPDLLIRNA